jgi:hypothetical protein
MTAAPFASVLPSPRLARRGVMDRVAGDMAQFMLMGDEYGDQYRRRS